MPLIALFLAGCGSQPSSDWSSLRTMSESYFTGRGDSLPLEEVKKVPYASLGMRVGSSPQMMIVQTSVLTQDQLWTSASQLSLITRNGRIIRSGGFGHDLSGAALESNAETPRDYWLRPHSWSWAADFQDKSLYSLPVACRRQPVARERIGILGRGFNTIVVEENCEAASIGWRFTNSFWVDAESGFVWRSRQAIHPDLDVIELEVLRPAE